jgi:hypothetical protein
MNRAEVVFPALIFATAALLLLTGYFVLHYSWAVLAFPVLSGVTLCALCLLDIGMTLMPRAGRPSATRARAEPISITGLAWALSLLLFVYALGFVFGPAAYLLIYLLTHGSSWRFSVVVAAASLLVTWGLFIKVLHILLPMYPLWWPW